MGRDRASTSPSPLWGGNKGGGAAPSRDTPPRTLHYTEPRATDGSTRMAGGSRPRIKSAEGRGRKEGAWADIGHKRGADAVAHPHPRSLPTRGREALGRDRASASPSPLWGGNKGGGAAPSRDTPPPERSTTPSRRPRMAPLGWRVETNPGPAPGEDPVGRKALGGYRPQARGRCCGPPPPSIPPHKGEGSVGARSCQQAQPSLPRPRPACRSLHPPLRGSRRRRSASG